MHTHAQIIIHFKPGVQEIYSSRFEKSRDISVFGLKNVGLFHSQLAPNRQFCWREIAKRRYNQLLGNRSENFSSAIEFFILE